MSAQQPEPWLRGTLAEVDAVRRAVLHALELAAEDLREWCGGLSGEELNARPYDLAPVAFHLRHIARSLDRLLTYAEGSRLNAAQLSAMKSELDPGAERGGLFVELEEGFDRSALRVRAFLWRITESSVEWEGRNSQRRSAACWCTAPTIPSGMWGRL